MGLSPAVPFLPPFPFSASSRGGGTPCRLAACVPAALRTRVRTRRAVSECSCAALRTSVSFRLDAFGGIVSACRCAHPVRCAGCRRAPRRAARRRCCGVLRRAPFSSPAGRSSGRACARDVTPVALGVSPSSRSAVASGVARRHVGTCDPFDANALAGVSRRLHPCARCVVMFGRCAQLFACGLVAGVLLDAVLIVHCVLTP